MITEQQKEQEKIRKIEDGIRTCEEGIAKAEKYERLKENKDWQDYLNDLKVVADMHDREIRAGEAMLVDAPNTGYMKLDGFGNQKYVSSREDWVDFIMRHQIQKADCLAWLKEPEQILTFAALCREKLPLLQEQLKEFKHEPIGVEGNGKS